MSKSRISRAERVRRLRKGNLVRLFNFRWGPELPDDQSGREDLLELLRVDALGPDAAVHMPKTIGLYASWMEAAEATDLIEFMGLMQRKELWPTPKELGERQRLTNAERERLQLWSILPFDMTDAELAEQRKAKKRARAERARRKRGA